jgi:predicted dehydrogenase
MKAIVIGTGFGARVAAPAYRKAGFEVEVVSPRDTDAVRRACAAPAGLVSVHSPPFLHREHVLLALENKRNVLCDKPFGTSSGQARQMLEGAEAAGVLHFLNFEFRQETIRQKAKELLDQGAIGTVKHVQWTAMMSGSRFPQQRYRWLWDNSLGGGWIGAFGSHVINALRWWFGEIETASGVRRNEIATRRELDGVDHLCTAEDAFSACFTMKNGVSAVVDAAYAATYTRPYAIEIFGSEGMMVLDTATLLELKRPGEPDKRFDVEPWSGDMHEPSFTRWAALIRDAVRADRQIAPSFRDGLACVEAMERLRANSVWLSQQDFLAT